MDFIPRNFSFFTLKIRFYKVYFWINFRLSNHNVTPGSSENPYDEARSAEFYMGIYAYVGIICLFGNECQYIYAHNKHLCL